MIHTIRSSRMAILLTKRFSWLLVFGLLCLVASFSRGAITIDATTSTDQSTAASTIMTSAFSTASGNELLLAFVATDYLSGANTTVTNVTGSGLTWVLVGRTNAQNGSSEIWRAFSISPLSNVTVAATLSQSVTSSLTVMSFAGVDTSGMNGSGAIGATSTGNSSSGAPTASLITTRNGSMVVGVGNDFNQAIDRTVGANQMLVHQYLAPVGDTYWVQRQSAPTPASGTTVSINDTVPKTDAYNLGICEVLPAISGGQTWTISGTLSPSGIGSGTTVALSGALTRTVAADTSGSFSFAGLANGTYTVTPTRSGYTFTPASQTVTLSGANLSGVNFVLQPAAIHLIQKNVNGNESTVSNIFATFPSNNTAGNLLVITGTAARPHGTITVSDTAGNSYLPAIGPVTDPAQDMTGYVWYVPNCKGGANTVTLTPSTPAAMEIHISEFAGIAASSPLDQVAFATGTGPDASSGARTTALNGELIFGYTFLYNTASAGAGYTGMSLVNGDLDEYFIQPTAGSIAATFTQTSGTWFALMATFHPAGGSVGRTWNISGTLSPSGIGSGTTVALSGAATGTVTADSSGSYSFAGLANGTYTITPTRGGYTFMPASQSVTINGANATTVNFTAQATSQTWSISGTITPSAAGNKATVTLSGASAATVTADSSGNYSFSGLANGSYNITPSQNGFTFSPGTSPVTLSNANATGINFTGQASGPPPASLAVDLTTSADGTAASSTIATLPFSTNSGNELLLAFVTTDYLSGSNTTVNSVSGGGITWALVRRTNVQPGSSEIWRAFSASKLSGATVTATLSQSVICSITVMSFSGVDTSGANGSGAIGATGTGNSGRGAPTAGLVTTRNGSWVVGVGNDYDNAVNRTPGPGQSLIHQDLTAVGDTYWVQIQSGITPNSGTTVTINDTSPTTDRYNLSICEVLNGSGVVTSKPPTVSVTAPVGGSTVSNLSTLWAVASDQTGVAGVQFFLDGSPLGSQITTPPYTMTWNTTQVVGGAHVLAARAQNTVGLTTTSAPVTVTVDNSGNAAVVGSWSAVVNIPTVAVNLVLLNNNKVFFYEDGVSPTVWDYINGTFTNVPTSADLFCSGDAILSDGRLLVTGGFGGGDSDGIANAEIFDPSTNIWTAVPKMSYKRWYPGSITLSDGRVLVTAGWGSGPHDNIGIPEIYDPTTNAWTKLTGANNPFENYPFNYQLSDGRVVHVGGSEYAVVTDILNLNTQTWSVVDPNIVDGGSSAMYLPGKIMKAGSAADSQSVGPSANTTYVLDMTQPAPAWQQTPSMAYPRSFMNLVTLPDGTVLAVGGETDKNGGDISKAVYNAELWSPVTQTWTTMSSMHTPREYHGTALLLPDARVLVSGMGSDFGNVPDEKNAEFYSPPYLSKGARPTISQVPTQISYNTNFFIGTPDAANIAKAVLIRAGAVTHFFNANASYVPLTIQQASGGLTLTVPANGNLAPPGYYMLFIVNSAGVPSIAPLVQLH